MASSPLSAWSAVSDMQQVSTPPQAIAEASRSYTINDHREQYKILKMAPVRNDRVQGGSEFVFYRVKETAVLAYNPDGSITFPIAHLEDVVDEILSKTDYIITEEYIEAPIGD